MTQLNITTKAPHQANSSLFRKFLSTLFTCSLSLSAIGLLLISLVGMAGTQRWFLDSFSHFRVQYVLLSIGLLFFTVLFRKSIPFFIRLIPLLTLGINGVYILPYVVPTAEANAWESTDDTIRMMTANLYYHNERPDLVLAAVEAAQPDILVLVEMGRGNKERLAILDPHFEEKYSDQASNTVIYANIPLNDLTLHQITKESRIQTHFRFEMGDETVSVIASHAPTPLNSDYFESRNEELAATAALTSAIDGPVIVTGDLNISPFSPNFQRFVMDGNLKDGRIGQGIHPSWNVHIPFMRIPIDHFLASDEIKVHNFETGQVTGSDHLPIIVDFSLAAN